MARLVCGDDALQIGVVTVKALACLYIPCDTGRQHAYDSLTSGKEDLSIKQQHIIAGGAAGVLKNRDMAGREVLSQAHEPQACDSSGS